MSLTFTTSTALESDAHMQWTFSKLIFLGVENCYTILFQVPSRYPQGPYSWTGRRWAVAWPSFSWSETVQCLIKQPQNMAVDDYNFEYFFVCKRMHYLWLLQIYLRIFLLYEIIKAKVWFHYVNFVKKLKIVFGGGDNAVVRNIMIGF